MLPHGTTATDDRRYSAFVAGAPSVPGRRPRAAERRALHRYI
jgi:hypothetical protein